ncbi:MAG: acylphosphatase [Planctomycetota bacterium]
MSGDEKRYVVIFQGRVQGVGFRATTVVLAEDLSVNGYVRNEPDGTVRLDADGPADHLEKLLGRIRRRMATHIFAVDVRTMQSDHRTGGLVIEH